MKRMTISELDNVKLRLYRREKLSNVESNNLISLTETKIICDVHVFVLVKTEDDQFVDLHEVYFFMSRSVQSTTPTLYCPLVK